MTDRRRFIRGTAAAVVTAGNATVANAQAPAEQPGTDSALPKDVYASSRNRAPLITRDMLVGEENQKAYDGITHGTTIAGIQGPAGISLYSQKVNRIAAQLNVALRTQSGLDPRLAEIVMLVAARESDQAFEWSAHERTGRAAGVEDAIIDVIRNRKPVNGLGEKEAAIVTLGREAIGKHKVAPKTFATAQRLFGTETLVNMCLLMGNYLMTGLLLTTFDQQLPAGVASTLPIP